MRRRSPPSSAGSPPARDGSATSCRRSSPRYGTTRRNALLRALARHGIEAHGRSGLNVWIPVAEESGVVQALMRKRWAVNAGERYRLQSRPAIRVTISTLTEARKFASDLAEVLTSRSAAAA